MKKLLLGISCLIMLGLLGCQKDSDIFIPNEVTPPPIFFETGDISRFDDEAPVPVSHYSWEADKDHQIVTPNNLYLFFPANTLVDSMGNTISGLVEAEVYELFSKGNMILGQRPTLANNLPLESVGEFGIKVTQNGNALQLSEAALQVQLPAQLILPEIKVFYGASESQRYHQWSLENAAPVVELFEIFDSIQGTSEQRYVFTTSNLGWLNCADYLPQDQPQTTLCVELPVEYKEENAAVYVVLRDRNTVMELIWTDDIEEQQFCLSNIPSNVEASLIVIANKGPEEYAFSQFDLVVSGQSMLVPMEPESLSLEAIQEQLTQL